VLGEILSKDGHISCDRRRTASLVWTLVVEGARGGDIVKERKRGDVRDVPEQILSIFDPSIAITLLYHGSADLTLVQTCRNSISQPLHGALFRA
jgi:hypothetical protein